MTPCKPKKYLAKKDEVFRFFGGANATARAFGISTGATAQWGEFIPEIRARQLEEISGGQLKPTITEQ
ncbi:Cro/CI family transcriptional regulator [Pseudaeromonas paramecii]|uniref:Cro/Cl family transcriptional regulator n=1 Tax=Pseudaeromonas paramecii TaxID=2138166 RepID=A0ABP8PYQ9_9GAMM